MPAVDEVRGFDQGATLSFLKIKDQDGYPMPTLYPVANPKPAIVIC